MLSLRKFLSVLFIISMLFFELGNIVGCNANNPSTSILTPVSTPPITSSTTQLVTVSYKKYEIKPDDRRFEYFKHPLYSFEYPSIFELIDGELAEVSYDETKVIFYVQYKELPKPELSIFVQQSASKDREYHNASEKLDYEIAMRPEAISITKSEINIVGLKAYNAVFFYNVKSKYESQYEASERICLFDYKNLIWEIRLNWNYHGKEAPEVQGFFDHIIETFKIQE